MTSAATFWSRTAANYAKSPIADPDAWERGMARTRSYLRPTDTVLELGCGTGTTALRLAPHVGRYVGTDIAPGMIEIAEGKQPGHANLEFKVAGVEDTSARRAFDAVLAFNLLHLVDDLEAAIETAFDALKPGGYFITKTFVRPDRFSPAFLAIRAAIPVMRLVGKAPPVNFPDHASLRGALGWGGFFVVEDTVDARGALTRHFVVARKPLGDVSQK
ncbi:MAG: class I SAM-dependent methyltransferase [Shimia sp.]